MKKIALLSMDVEDWYHLDYVSASIEEKKTSMLDGLSHFLRLVEDRQVPATFFVLSEIVDKISVQLSQAILKGHEIALHGTNHRRPLTMAPEEFETDCLAGQAAIEEALGVKVQGYRAPCFSLDRERLDVLRGKLNFLYDSSRINFEQHPLYGTIDMIGFEKKIGFVFNKEGFLEFEMPTEKVLGFNLPISGGGYLRILPWFLMKLLIRAFARRNHVFSIYLHPFEMSQVRPPEVSGLNFANSARFHYNINSVPKKLFKLIELLRTEGYEFMTYTQAQRRLENLGME